MRIQHSGNSGNGHCYIKSIVIFRVLGYHPRSPIQNPYGSQIQCAKMLQRIQRHPKVLGTHVSLKRAEIRKSDPDEYCLLLRLWMVDLCLLQQCIWDPWRAFGHILKEWLAFFPSPSLTETNSSTNITSTLFEAHFTHLCMFRCSSIILIF